MDRSSDVLAGKHAVVTGGARGIGLAIAQHLVRSGAKVSVISRSALCAPGDAAFFRARADVSDEGDVARAIAQCRDVNGPVAILINNSGISESAPLIRTGKTMWDRVIATNLTGTFLCTREVLGDMLAERYGRIVNIASIAGLYGAPYIAAYCASKHGVVGLTRALAAETAGTGITVNDVCPGYTETDMMAQAIASIVKHTGMPGDAARQRLAQMNPEGRIATVEEVADVVMALLTSDRTGESIIVPGGMRV